MCGRLTQSRDADRYARMFGLSTTMRFIPQYNVTPWNGAEHLQPSITTHAGSDRVSGCWLQEQLIPRGSQMMLSGT